MHLIRELNVQSWGSVAAKIKSLETEIPTAWDRTAPDCLVVDVLLLS